jgi:hypothetical protein
MHHIIGDCIDFEAWLTFGPEPIFTNTGVNRDFCGPHSVNAAEGSYSIDGVERLQYSWSREEGYEESRRVTAVIVPGEGFGEMLPEGYETGDRRLNLMGYRRQTDGSYLRNDDHLTISRSDPGYYQDLQFTAEVSLDGGIPSTVAPTECHMTVTLTVSVDAGTDAMPIEGVETFEFDCSRVEGPDDSWPRIAAAGYEESAYSGNWMDLFQDRGIWDRYPVAISNAMYDLFRPVLSFDPADESRLFRDVYNAWYVEMVNPPPTSIEP